MSPRPTRARYASAPSITHRDLVRAGARRSSAEVDRHVALDRGRGRRSRSCRRALRERYGSTVDAEGAAGERPGLGVQPDARRVEADHAGGPAEKEAPRPRRADASRSGACCSGSRFGAEGGEGAARGRSGEAVAAAEPQHAAPSATMLPMSRWARPSSASKVSQASVSAARRAKPPPAIPTQSVPSGVLSSAITSSLARQLPAACQDCVSPVAVRRKRPSSCVPIQRSRIACALVDAPTLAGSPAWSTCRTMRRRWD